jgi:DNA-binding transcriptional LysR family regulator
MQAILRRKPRTNSRRHRECAELARIWPDEPPALRTAWLVVHQDLRRSARIRVVTSAIADAFRRHSRILRNGTTGRKVS